MPAKVTSRIAWKTKEQKKRAVRIATKRSGSLSADIQNFYGDEPDAPDASA